MVAKIIIGKKIRGVLHYNENKVEKGQARLILASAFAGDIEEMNFNQKLRRFENLLILKPKVKTNTLHITLNFDAAENLKTETLQKIAVAYMDKIGFGDQPFLAYRHHDAAHHHIHLVTTNIQANGEPISLHNIGRIHSEKARKEIELEFNLVKAQSKKYKPDPGIKPVDLAKALYGKTPTKRAISNTVNAVTSTYKFTSLAEFNAILRQFNVVADRGNEETEMFQKRGLVYSLLDKNGEKIGVPIKSSAFYSKPTLPWLEKEFEKHQLHRAPLKDELRNKVDFILKSGIASKASFIGTLEQQGVNVLFRESKTGQTYGLTFVDNIQKVVFNGSDLGKSYSAKNIIAQISNIKHHVAEPGRVATIIRESTMPPHTLKTEVNTMSDHQKSDLMENLLAPVKDYTGLLPKRKKKKKRGLTI